MSEIETVVRPFQLPDVVPPQRYVTSGQQSNAPVRLNIGRGGSGRTFSGSFSSKVTYYMDQQVVEKSS